MVTVLSSPAMKRCMCGMLNPTKGNEQMSQVLSAAIKSYLRSGIAMRRRSSLSNDTLPVEAQEKLISQLSLKMRSSDEAVLDSYTQFVQRAANVLNLDVSRKIVLPRHIEKRTLLKSPHIYKKHRVQYELRTHARMLQMREVTGDTADIFLEYIQRNIPEGVSMTVEQTELETIPEYLQFSVD